MYTWQQHRRRIDVDIYIDSFTYPEPVVILSAFNSGFHTTVLIDYQFTVIIQNIHFYDVKTYFSRDYITNPEYDIVDQDYQDNDQKFSLVLKEGEQFRVVFKAISLQKFIKDDFIKGDLSIRKEINAVKVAACFITWKNKRICSKSIKFRLRRDDKPKNLGIINNKKRVIRISKRE